MAVFPVLGTFGYGAGVEFKEILRVYPNLAYRRYKQSNSPHKTRRLSFDEISQSEYESIEAFYIARKQASGSDHEFFVYDPNVVNAVDPSGVSTTGRHTAIFLDSQIEFTRDGPCSYSGEINVLFLD